MFEEHLLEFGAVKDLLRARAASGLGLARIDALAPLTDPPRLREAVTACREMMAFLTDRRHLPLDGLRDVTELLAKVARERSVLDPPELLDLAGFCEVSDQVRRCFEPLAAEYPALHHLAMPLHGLSALVRSVHEKISPAGEVRDTASDQLQRLRSEIRSTESRIQRELERMIQEFFASGDLQDDFFTLRNGRYVLPVKTSNRGKVPGIIHDSSNTGETVFIEPFAVLEQSNQLADLRLREREEVFRILLRIAGHIRDELNVLRCNREILADFDLIHAKARYGTEYNCAFPALTESHVPMHLAEAHHPLLLAASRENSRPLDLPLDSANRVLVITGPNAGGKTTALKTVGLCVLMVQSGIPAPVHPRSRMPVFRQVLADIGDEQSLTRGTSTFSGHMMRLKGILEQATHPALVLLDELGTATDPEEGGALAVALVERLCELGVLVLVSTHLAALKNWAEAHPAGRNASFRLSELEQRPTFRLAMDVPGVSEALIVAEQVGLPPALIARARSLRPQGELDSTALIISLQEKEQRLAIEVDEAERLRAELEAERTEIARLREQLRAEKRTYKRELADESRRAIAELKAKVEQLIARQPSRQELQQMRDQLAREQASASTGPEPDRTGPGIHAERLREGVTVRLANGATGTVERIEKEGRAVRVLMGIAAVRVPIEEIEAVVEEGGTAAAASTGGGVIQLRRGASMVSGTLDVHGLRVDEMIAQVDKFLDDAVIAGLHSVNVVHGQGTGRLRKGLHDHLRSHPQVKTFRHGDAAEGKGGSTVVELK